MPSPNVEPEFQRDKDSRTMGITFHLNNAPRVYVERVDINGNTLTQDKVVRREFRLAEGDAFNSFQVKRSTDRIQLARFLPGQDGCGAEARLRAGPHRARNQCRGKVDRRAVAVGGLFQP
jgi:outer membrane protein insertion porin family